ncbi:hypothetical protein MRB53_001907 [Persea americana]|uniref:Uncharacterized protein n=1 Tax=Persea americana TaxID=3435 RepID=A0ACC2MUN5_PERAE|nr:hypothetical protein MRB53_001907 [Persea americana]
MTEHLDDFNKIIVDLMNIDVKIDDEDKALLLLNSLPDSYDHFTHTLINRKTEVKYDVVSAILMNNEYRKKDKQAHKDSSSDALTNEKNGSQEESKANGRSKEVEFDVIPAESEGDDTNEEETPAQEPPQEQADSITASRRKRNIRKPQRFTDMVAYVLPMVEECVPTTNKEAKRHSESVKWQNAIDEEMKFLPAGIATADAAAADASASAATADAILGSGTTAWGRRSILRLRRSPHQQAWMRSGHFGLGTCSIGWRRTIYTTASLSLGEVLSVKVIRNKQTGQTEGYGFIEFANRAAAERTLQEYNGTLMPNSEQSFRLNWASFGSGDKRSDDGPDFPIFVETWLLMLLITCYKRHLGVTIPRLREPKLLPIELLVILRAMDL